MILGRGVDYSFESYPIKFIAGETSVPLNIGITYDDICELNETFSLTIDPYSILINGITVGHPDQTTVTIIDECEYTCQLISIHNLSVLSQCASLLSLLSQLPEEPYAHTNA